MHKIERKMEYICIAIFLVYILLNNKFLNNKF